MDQFEEEQSAGEAGQIDDSGPAVTLKYLWLRFQVIFTHLTHSYVSI